MSDHVSAHAPCATLSAMDSSTLNSSAMDSSAIAMDSSAIGVGVAVLVGKCMQGPCSAVPDWGERGLGASVGEPHLGSSTRPLSVCQSVYIYIYIYIYISYVRHFWSRGPRATRKRKPAHLKFKGHMHACCITSEC